MDFEVPQPALLALLRAIIRTDLLRAEGAPRELPWEELCAALLAGSPGAGGSTGGSGGPAASPGGAASPAASSHAAAAAEHARALRLAQGAQRALARAAHEAWAPAQLEAYLVSGGLEGGRAAAAGALWAREREGALAAVAARAFAAAPRLVGAPVFSVATLTASAVGAGVGSSAAGGHPPTSPTAAAGSSEPLAMLRLQTSEGPVVVEASRSVLAAAAAALGLARRAVAASGSSAQ
jgi:hypothetical protein